MSRLCRQFNGIKIGESVMYNGQVFRISTMYYEDGCSTPTCELVHLKLDRNKPLAVPVDRVTKIMNEGSSDRASSAKGSTMLYS